MDGTGRVRVLERELFSYPLRCTLTRLDSGVHVLLTGGSRTHIGAVSTAEPEGEVETKTFPGHKDQLISEPWAKALARKTGARALVVCGIHYDGISRAQIETIVETTNAMLREALAEL